MDGALVLALTQITQLSSSLPQLQSTVTLAATTASVTYDVVTPYPRILVLWDATSTATAAAEQLYMQFNGVSGAKYMWVANQNNQTTVSGTNSGSSLVDFMQVGTIGAASATANYASSGCAVIDGANQSVVFPSVQGTGAAFATIVNMFCGIYAGQYTTLGPLTSVTLLPAAGSFSAGSRFSFYGLT